MHQAPMPDGHGDQDLGEGVASNVVEQTEHPADVEVEVVQELAVNVGLNSVDEHGQAHGHGAMSAGNCCRSSAGGMNDGDAYTIPIDLCLPLFQNSLGG